MGIIFVRTSCVETWHAARAWDACGAYPVKPSALRRGIIVDCADGTLRLLRPTDSGKRSSTIEAEAPIPSFCAQNKRVMKLVFSRVHDQHVSGAPREEARRARVRALVLSAGERFQQGCWDKFPAVVVDDGHNVDCGRRGRPTRFHTSRQTAARVRCA